MSISEREQQSLESIESGLTRSAPKLASMLGIFTRLTADEKMPPRRPVRRFISFAAARPLPGRPAPGRPRRLRLSRPVRRWMWLAVAVALLILTVTLSHGTGASSCLSSHTAVCGQAPGHPGAARPAGPSPGESGGPVGSTGGPPPSPPRG